VQITDGLREVVEVVVHEASSHVKRSPKILSPSYPEQDLQQQSRFRRPTLGGTVRAVQVMGMRKSSRIEREKREMS
jgi:hypothetical protein